MTSAAVSVAVVARARAESRASAATSDAPAARNERREKSIVPRTLASPAAGWQSKPLLARALDLHEVRLVDTRPGDPLASARALRPRERRERDGPPDLGRLVQRLHHPHVLPPPFTPGLGLPGSAGTSRGRQ